MPEQSWTHQDIALALKLKGWTQRQLAAELKLSTSTVSYALRTGSSVKLREKVEQILQISWTTLWPHRCPPQWRDGDPP
jgi:lambda repressor-like predicted transcriptional regulator